MVLLMANKINSSYLREGTLYLLSRYYKEHKDYEHLVPSWVQIVLSSPSLLKDTLEVFKELQVKDVLKKIDTKVYRYSKKYRLRGRYLPVFLTNESLINVESEAKEFLEKLTKVIETK